MIRASFDSRRLSPILSVRSLRTAGRQLVSLGQSGNTGKRVGVVGAQLRLAELERRLVQRDRLGQSARGRVGVGQVAAAAESVGVVGAQLGLAELERLLSSAIASGPAGGSGRASPDYCGSRA